MNPKTVKMPPINKRQLQLMDSLKDKELAIRDPIEIKKIAKQSDMIRDMRKKFDSIEKELKKNPNFDIKDKDLELLRSYVVASILFIL